VGLAGLGHGEAPVRVVRAGAGWIRVLG